MIGGVSDVREEGTQGNKGRPEHNDKGLRGLAHVKADGTSSTPNLQVKGLHCNKCNHKERSCGDCNSKIFLKN